MTRIEVSSIDQWRAVASNHIVPLHFSPTAGTFRARFESRRLGRYASVFELATDGVIVERTPSLAREGSGDDVFLAVQMQSSGTFTQFGREATMPTGSAVLFDPRYPYQFDHSQPGQQQLTLRVRRDALDVRGRMLGTVPGLLAEEGSPQTTVFRQFLTTLWGVCDQLDDRGRAAMEAAAVGFAVALAGSLAGTSVESRADVLYRTALMNVSTYAAIPTFAVAELAELCNVSPRTLHEVFAARGATPAGVIRQERVRRAVDLLAQPTNMTVASVAATCGFADVATFTRAFSRAIGTSPGQFRKQHSRTR